MTAYSVRRALWSVVLGCEYGDRDPHCVTLERAQCYNDSIRSHCCATCGRLFNASAIGAYIGLRQVTLRP